MGASIKTSIKIRTVAFVSIIAIALSILNQLSQETTDSFALI